MAVTYIIIDFSITGESFDGAYQAGTKELIADAFGEMLDDGKTGVVQEITFDKGAVTEHRDVTNEITEIAAAARLAGMDMDVENFPAWVEATDAYEAALDGDAGITEASNRREHGLLFSEYGYARP